MWYEYYRAISSFSALVLLIGRQACKQRLFRLSQIAFFWKPEPNLE